MDLLFEQARSLTPAIRDAVCQLIAEGGEVKTTTLMSRLLETKEIGYAIDGTVLVATVAMKTPHDAPSDSAFAKVGFASLYDQFHCELGYVMVSRDYRGKGIASKLCELMCDRFQHENIYATIRAENSQMKHVLLKIGFAQFGTHFRNRTDTDDLQLYVRYAIAPR
jgi:RimJ/RimL family protein N-acetyltransferase